MQQTLGLQLLGSLCESGLEKYIHLRLEPWMFTLPELPVFEYMDKHVAEFGQVPAQGTIEKHTGIALITPAEPPAYYYQEVFNRYLHTQIKLGLSQANENLKAKDPRKALEVVTGVASNLASLSQRNELVDFAKEAHDMISAEYHAQQTLGDEYGIRTGWGSFDKKSGGLRGGDVLTIVGRPGTGKTYLGLQVAHNVWKNQKKVPLFVSMEMKALPILQRIAAIETSTPADWINKAELPTTSFSGGDSKETEVFKHLKGLENEGRPFWVVDGNLAATARDITMLARQLKPDVIIVDGAYLVTSTSKSWKAGWEKIKEVVEELKKDAGTKMDIPVIVSYQFNREAEKSKTLEDVGLEHIAGGDAIGQISSIVLGVFDKVVEGLIKKRIRILKGRSGETGDFYINWLFNQYPYMDFSEISQEEEEGDLSYLM